MSKGAHHKFFIGMRQSGIPVRCAAFVVGRLSIDVAKAVGVPLIPRGGISLDVVATQALRVDVSNVAVAMSFALLC